MDKILANEENRFPVPWELEFWCWFDISKCRYQKLLPRLMPMSMELIFVPCLTLIYRYMKASFEAGYVYIAQPHLLLVGMK